MSQRTFDYVIVGGGSAGCVLANRLSADGKSSILLLEAGPPDRNPWIHIPIGYGKTMGDAKYSWQFHTEPEPQMNGRRIHFPQGRTLGGSSSINGLIYTRGQAEDFDRWEALGNVGWGAREALHYFIRSETNSRGANPYHGDDGPLHVSDIGGRHELVDAFIGASEELGIPRNEDFNGVQQEGAGYLQLTTRKGLRCSTAVGYLKPARKRSNLSVETDARADSILFEGMRAVGVRYASHGTTATVRAAREVLLCAGALQSPKILHLSGVGPGMLLQQHGIPVIADLPGVGENLHDHLHVKFVYRCTKAITTNDDLRSVWGKARIGLKWALLRRGPMAVGVMLGSMFTRVLPDAKSPDVQFYLSTLSADLRGAQPHPFSGFTVSFYQLRPTSRGSVRITSKDPSTPPAILINFLATEDDRTAAIAAARMVRRLSATRSLAAYIAAEHQPGSGVQSDEDLLEYIQNFGSTGFHPVGTCRMGRDAGAVVDARLRVHGLHALRVVDASVMPTIVSANTNAPTIMIAEKAAEMISEDATPAVSVPKTSSIGEGSESRKLMG